MIKHIQQVIWLSTTGYSFFSRRKIPEIVVSYEINVQAGVSFYNNETASVSIGTKSDSWKTVFDKLKTNIGYAIGGSVAESYANDSMSTKVAADFGYAIKAYEIEKEALEDIIIHIDEKGDVVYGKAVLGVKTKLFLKMKMKKSLAWT